MPVGRLQLADVKMDKEFFDDCRYCIRRILSNLTYDTRGNRSGGREAPKRIWMRLARGSCLAAPKHQGQSPMKSNAILSAEQLSQEYYDQLLTGDRLATRNLIEAALHQGITPRDLLTDLVWPTMEMLQGMYREDRITITQ